MRISDWSSDVCSSDLSVVVHELMHGHARLKCVLAQGGIRLFTFTRDLLQGAQPARLRLYNRLAHAGNPCLNPCCRRRGPAYCPLRPRRDCSRSAEHTSELQSLIRISYAVL